MQQFAVMDEQTAKACNLLEAEGIPTTPSGAVGLAGLKALALNSNSRALILVTEGSVA